MGWNCGGFMVEMVHQQPWLNVLSEGVMVLMRFNPLISILVEVRNGRKTCL
jgi:hypothetical protein